MNIAKIRTKKIVDLKLGESYKIIGFENIAKEKELPRKYMNESHFVIDTDGNSILISKLDLPNITIGNKYKKSLWEEKIIPYLKECGNRLHEIMEEHREEQKIWNGEETFII